MDTEIRALAEAVGERLVEQGAKATLLTGSHDRGQARPNSDVDLFAVGEGPESWMGARRRTSRLDVLLGR